MPSSNKMLVAVTVFKALDVVCDYAIRLAKRSGKQTMLFILLIYETGSDEHDRDREINKLENIREIGKTAHIEIDYEIVEGHFPKKVAEYLYKLDCPLLVAGDSCNRTKRLRELKEIEALLISDHSWHHRNSHHFLMVSEREQEQDSVLVYLNRDGQKKEKE